MSIASGIISALFVLSLGYAYSYIMDGQSTLLTNQLRALLGIVTSGLSFGYWLGLSIKDETSENYIKLFFMAFFGTFCSILLYLLVSQKEYIQLLPLFFAIAMPALIINSGLIEHERLQFFDKAIKVFSEKISFPILAFYFASSFLELEDIYLFYLIGAIVGFYLILKLGSYVGELISNDH